MGPLTLNAYYSPPDNHFVLLQGILQFPFYDPKGSEIENFGGIGMVIGHELGHSIDDHGSQFDSTGKIRDWMKTEDHEAFKKRTEVFITQFNGIGHDGKLTLGENIGDHVGLRAAYRAAFHGKNPSLQDQKRFFTSFARVWCGMMLPKTRENLLKTDPHALGEARVNQQVMHIDGFQEAYGCKKGNALYLDPEKRVKVW
jgi:putative endopeptidase